MAKCWSATSVVVLALLGCLVGTEVEAQDTVPWKKPAPPPLPPPWQNPQNPQAPPYPPVLQPKPQNPQPPQLPKPQDPQLPPYPPPQLPRPQDPQLPPYPPPKLPRPQDPQFPPYPLVLQQKPQNPQPPQLPKPQDPQFPPPPPPQLPRPQDPQFPPYTPPKLPRPQDPQFPPYTPPQLPRPQDPQFPPYTPPKLPRPQDPQFPPYTPPKLPRPQDPQLPPYPPPKLPRPQDPQFPPYTPPKLPRPQDPQLPPYPPPKLQRPQDPQFPPYLPPQLPRPQDPQLPPWPLPPKQPIPPLPQIPSDQNPKVPKFPQDPKVPNFPQDPKVPPVVPPVYTCDVDRNVRVPCGGSQVGSSAAACEAINCCFDGQQCYFGKTVTVQCTQDAQFIVVVARDATLPSLDLQTISLLGGGQGCTNVDSNSAFAIYQFPVTSCGTIFMEEPGAIIYENRMTSSYEVDVGPFGSITRDSHYDLVFRCRYIGTHVETLIIEILPLQSPPLPVSAVGPIKVIMRLANGQCYTKGCNELDVVYSSFYTDADYPVTKVLRDPVYVEVQLLEKTDPMLVLTLGRCWVTTTPYPHSFPQWDILVDGCPYRDDNYLSSLVPVGPNSGLDFPSHYRRFFFKMFTFVGSPVKSPAVKESMNEKLYLHCSTAVCVNGQFVSCEPACTRRKRDVEAADQKQNDPKTVVSSGPLIITAPEQ